MFVKIIFVAFLAFNLVNSVPLAEDRDARILRSESDDKELQDGKFRYFYETSNGQAQEAQGQIKNPEAAPEDQILQIRGSYSYIDANGQPIRVEYTADENGFVPKRVEPVKPIVVVPAPAPAVRVVSVPAPVIRPAPVTYVQAAPVPVAPHPVRQTVLAVNPYDAYHHAYQPQNYVVYNPNNYFGHGLIHPSAHYNPYLAPRYV